jgi:uncharacterized protein (DUF433 family)
MRQANYLTASAPTRFAMSWQEHITVDPNVLVGKPIIRGTRIAVEFVLDLLGRGWTTEQMLGEYDHITIADIQACQQCAELNRTIVRHANSAHSASTLSPRSSIV